MLALTAAPSAFGHDNLDTIAGHFSQDSGSHDVSAEPAMVTATRRATRQDARAAAAAVAGNEHLVGQWGPVVDWPVVGTHVALLPYEAAPGASWWTATAGRTPPTAGARFGTRTLGGRSR